VLRARRAATFKILRAIGIDLMHKHAYMMAKLVEERAAAYGGLRERRHVRHE
jgi:hypothetical protein